MTLERLLAADVLLTFSRTSRWICWTGASSFGRLRFDVVSGRVAGRDRKRRLQRTWRHVRSACVEADVPHGAKQRTPSKQNDFNMYYDHPSEDDALYGVAGRPYSTPVDPPSGRAGDDRATTVNRGYTRCNPVEARRSLINPDRQPFNDDYNTCDKYKHSLDEINSRTLRLCRPVWPYVNEAGH